MLFADVIDPEKLAQAGSPYVLSVAVVAVSAALVYVFKTWRSDVKEAQTKYDADRKEQQAKHDQDKREQRAEYTDALKEMSDAVRAVATEAKAGAAATAQLAAESKANTAAIMARLDRLEMHLPVER